MLPPIITAMRSPNAIASSKSILEIHAQETNSPDDQAVLEVFNQFFDSMRERDTVALRKTIARSDCWFFTSYSSEPPDMTISGSSAGTLKGFMKTVGNPDGRIGTCYNEFSNIEIQHFRGLSIVTADYKCYVDNQINNCGKYI